MKHFRLTAGSSRRPGSGVFFQAFGAGRGLAGPLGGLLAKELMLTDTARNELVELEHAMWREATRYDRDFQQRHFAPDFVEFGRSGRVYDRNQIIVTTGHPINARLENIHLRELSQDLVLITYDSVLLRAQGTAEYAHRSSSWVSRRYRRIMEHVA